jgi:hypothetical protein
MVWDMPWNVAKALAWARVWVMVWVRVQAAAWAAWECASSPSLKSGHEIPNYSSGLSKSRPSGRGVEGWTFFFDSGFLVI